MLDFWRLLADNAARSQTRSILTYLLAHTPMARLSGGFSVGREAVGGSIADKTTIGFAHGLWADGSCYSKVIPLLLADSFQVISTQNHLNTVADDAAAVRTSFARASGPVVLVGHSYGGTVITAAGTDKRVAALVYICAFAP